MSLGSIFHERIRQVESLVERTNKSSVLVVQQFPLETDSEVLYPNVRESVSNIMAFIELGDMKTLEAVIEASDGVFDAIAMDGDIKCGFSSSLIEYASVNVRKSKLLWYSDMSAWTDAGLNLVVALESGVYKKNVLLTGEGPLSYKIRNRLIEMGARVFVGRLHAPEIRDREGKAVALDKLPEMDLAIGAAIKERSFDPSFAEIMKQESRVYDIGIGNFSGEGIARLKAKSCTIFRIDIRAGISSAVLALFETDHLVNKVMGMTRIKGIELVAGGIMGGDGAVIIDDIHSPSHIIGIADGTGYIKKSDLSDKEEADLKFVAELISAGR